MKYLKKLKMKRIFISSKSNTIVLYIFLLIAFEMSNLKHIKLVYFESFELKDVSDYS